jgi:hypothetical protein
LLRVCRLDLPDHLAAIAVRDLRHIDSVTVVVAGFLTGLALGAFAGGNLSRRRPYPLLSLFALIESMLGLFGYRLPSRLRTSRKSDEHDGGRG